MANREDLDALRNRYTEGQLFEIIVAAAFGAATEPIAARELSRRRLSTAMSWFSGF